MTFLPHALLVALIYLWVHGVVPDLSILAVAAVAPFWVMWCQRGHSLRRAFLLGPVVMIGAAIAWWLLWDADERDWLMHLLAGAAIVAYAIYNLIVFAIAAIVGRRRRKRVEI